VTSGAVMKVKTPPTKLLDKTFWNPRPGIGVRFPMQFQR
jgi:hypothetical protein